MAYKKIKSYVAELERALDKIIAWFFAYPQDAFTLTKLSNELKIAKTNARRVISSLEDEDFLVVETVGGSWQIRADVNHSYFKTKKIPQNLMHIYESGILEEVKKQVPNARAAILFGSYRKGDDIPTSDIDIAVEVLDNKPLQIVELGIISQFGYRKNVKVKLHIFSRKNINLNTFANIANGIVLDGFLEVKP